MVHVESQESSDFLDDLAVSLIAAVYQVVQMDFELPCEPKPAFFYKKRPLGRVLGHNPSSENEANRELTNRLFATI